MVATRPQHVVPGAAEQRRVGLVVRVSTDRQARTEEGSLKNQLQRLRQHVQYKREVAGEDWSEAAVYELRAVSGKESMRSPEFERLFAEIRSGHVNTVLCTALDRICRSVKDFLNFFEFLNEHGVEFVCLKQHYDTTTPQGRLFVTIMMALAEFEREQTSERTRDATLARAERGLWNGGRLLGYDLDPDRKGYPVPNDAEAAAVDYAFDAYLELGSLVQTADAVNRRGYRTKSYTSRRGVHHPGREFALTSVQALLKNPAYIAKKVINRDARGREDLPPEERYRLVEAVWPPIVDLEKYERVQRLLASNSRTRTNGVKRARHTYAVSGLLHCGNCGTGMEGRSGTGRGGRKYFYYACRNADCPMRIVASEVEDAVLGRLGTLASDERLLADLVTETNRRLSRQAPVLRKRLRALERERDQVRGEADQLLSEWASLADSPTRGFLTDRLDGLATRRSDLERGIGEAQEALRGIEGTAVAEATVREALANAHRVYEHLRPHERKELMRLLLKSVEVGDRRMVLELYGTTERGAPRSETMSWLPDVDSNHEPSG